MKSPYCKMDCGNLTPCKDEKGNILRYLCTMDIKRVASFNKRGKPTIKKVYPELEVEDGQPIKTAICLRGEG